MAGIAATQFGGTVKRIEQAAVRRRVAATWVGFWLIMLGALVKRAQMLATWATRPLDPDAQVYRATIDAMKNPYDTSQREPGWLWLGRGWFRILGSSDVNLRLLSMILALCVIVATFYFVRDLTSSAALALATIAILAFHNDLAFQSIRGLRLEAQTLGIVLCAYFAFVPGIRTRRRIVGLALTATAATLVNLSSALLVVMLTGYAVWRYRLGLRRALLVPATMLVLLVPHFAYEKQHFGDPFWSSNIAAIFYRNYEFSILYKTGCDGCATAEEFQTNSLSGKRTTWLGYIFDYHPIRTVAERTTRGYAKALVRHDVEFRTILGYESRWMYVAYILGAIGMFFSRFRWILLVPVVGLGALAFIVPLGIDLRLLEHTSPFVAFIAAFSIAVVWKFVRGSVEWMTRLRLPAGSQHVVGHSHQIRDGKWVGTPEEQDEILRKMDRADRYNSWLMERGFNYLGQRVLDVGAGIGTHTSRFAEGREFVVAAEPDPAFNARLRERFKDMANVQVVEEYATSIRPEAFAPFDSIVCANVLEHIPDDQAALAHLNSLLAPGGHLLLLVPAHPALYGSVDEIVEHYRRYSRDGLRTTLTEAGFELTELRYVNPVGALGWFATSRILRLRTIPGGPLTFFDRLVPLLRVLDKVDVGFGLSLWAIARRPDGPPTGEKSQSRPITQAW